MHFPENVTNYQLVIKNREQETFLLFPPVSSFFLPWILRDIRHLGDARDAEAGKYDTGFLMKSPAITCFLKCIWQIMKQL